MNIEKIGSEEFFYNKTDNGNAIVLFSASWCNPCKKLKELIENTDPPSDSPDSQPILIEVDIDEFPHLTEKFKIKGVPNVLTFQSGKIINQSAGLNNEIFINQSKIIKLTKKPLQTQII